MLQAAKICLYAATLIGLTLPGLSQAQTRVGLHSSSGSCANCDLSGKDIPGMILRDADFSGSIFSRANLSGGKIYKTKMSKTHFKKAFLVKVEGKYVDFAYSEMPDVTLVEASFVRTKFQHADMRRADLAGASFIDSDFNHANLSSVSAPASDFTGSTFVAAEFDHANLQETILDKTILKDVEFGSAILRGASFKEADLSGADLTDALGLTQSQLDTACGDPDTQLPVNLTISYCTAEMRDERGFGHKHRAGKRPDHIVAMRLDRAVENLEDLLSDMPSNDVEMRKNLQKIHSELVSARRQIEK